MTKKTRISFLAFIVLLTTACGSSNNENAPAGSANKARELAKTSIITDGHIDVPYRLGKLWVDVSFSTEDGDFDYPRAVAGGLNAPFMSIYTPADKDTEQAREHADSMIGIVNRIVDESTGLQAVTIAASVTTSTQRGTGYANVDGRQNSLFGSRLIVIINIKYTQ